MSASEQSRLTWPTSTETLKPTGDGVSVSRAPVVPSDPAAHLQQRCPSSLISRFLAESRHPRLHLSQAKTAVTCATCRFCRSHSRRPAAPGLDCMVGFVHVPLLPEQVSDPERQPSMHMALQVAGLDLAIAACRDAGEARGGITPERTTPRHRHEARRHHPATACLALAGRGMRFVPQAPSPPKPAQVATPLPMRSFPAPRRTTSSRCSPRPTTRWPTSSSSSGCRSWSLYWIGNAQGQPVVDPAMSLAALPTYSDNDSGRHHPRWAITSGPMAPR